jgi:hypothetical protein
LSILEWLTLGLLIAAIVVPVCSGLWVIHISAKAGRAAIYTKIEELHRDVDTFRVETAAHLGRIDGRMHVTDDRISVIEGRSYQRRGGDHS